jgi:excisionase family DNA binding protein
MKRRSANINPDQIMTISSLAAYLRCSSGTIYRLLKSKEIPAFRLGGAWRSERAAIEQWLRRPSVGAKANNRRPPGPMNTSAVRGPGIFGRWVILVPLPSTSRFPIRTVGNRAHQAGLKPDVILPGNA